MSATEDQSATLQPGACSQAISLAVLLAVLCHAQALELPLHNNKPVDGLSDKSRCSWNCTVMGSDFLEEMKTTIAKKKVIRLVVKYEKRVTEKCVNQTSRNSSANITEHWQIWLANKQVSVLMKALESVANLMLYTDSNGDREEIRAICTLRPVNTTATEPTDYHGSSPIFSQSHLADLRVKFDSIDCNKETTNNSQPCIKITKSTGNKSSIFEGLLERGGWPLTVWVFLVMGFRLVFAYYSPAFLCLFSPTEITEDGVHQIVLDGASPVSLRSLIGNYFFAKEDTIWHRVRMFFLRAVVLPVLFLGPAMFAKYVRQKEIANFNIAGMSDFLHPFMIVCYVCYYVTACCTVFSSRGSSGGNDTCIVCNCIKPSPSSVKEISPRLEIIYVSSH